MIFIKRKGHWDTMCWFRTKIGKDLPAIPAEQWYQFFMAGRMSVIRELEIPKVLADNKSQYKEMLQ